MILPWMLAITFSDPNLTFN